MRSPVEVFEDHLQLSMEGRVEEDLARNYSEDVVFLTKTGIYRGYDGARYLADTLSQELPEVRFEYHTRLVEGDFAFLEWTARSLKSSVRDGADSYEIRDGRIVTHSIHYTVEDAI